MRCVLWKEIIVTVRAMVTDAETLKKYFNRLFVYIAIIPLTCSKKGCLA